MKIILASTSKYRRAQLESLGLTFSCKAPDVDEGAFKKEASSPKQLCELLARLKAESVAKNHPHDFVIGSDQLVDFNGEILGKPGTKQAAVEQLLKLSGHTHHLLTSLCVKIRDEVSIYTETTKLKMRTWNEEEIKNYVDKDSPVDCAGAYKLESMGRMLFESIDSKDHSAIVGLPLMALTEIMLQFKVPLPFQHQPRTPL
ncbi:MAG: septum formation protein Maf [Pseudobdellovibrionaceae bacterium]|nr:septum formation protein Maf [Bdellovibrionales bacterium]USN47999.1 MAG: septum formation protein Maf [Pseudobdellovibrionaceae bacterium]